MHKAEKKRKITGTGGSDKTAVVGARNRETGTVKATVVGKGNVSKDQLEGVVYEVVEAGATVYTDLHHGYRYLGRDFDHDTISHSGEYVRGQVHTNGIENFWALLKRGLHGTYVSVQPEHLFRYVGERVFTYNRRDLTDLGRFAEVLQAAAGRRLTYAELTGKD
jgi:transposase-like protein